ncbi:hypothetical protein [Halococcus hamelinensis]|nr:hypothetical protein [Halococcus hamelinensis]
MRKRVAVWAVVAVLIVSAALIGFQINPQGDTSQSIGTGAGGDAGPMSVSSIDLINQTEGLLTYEISYNGAYQKGELENALVRTVDAKRVQASSIQVTNVEQHVATVQVATDGDENPTTLGNRMLRSLQLNTSAQTATSETSTATESESSEANATHYQIDFVQGEAIENLRHPPSNYYTPDKLIRYAHGSTENTLKRSSDGEFTTNDTLASAVESSDIVVMSNGTARVSFRIAEGADPVTLTLASYEKPGPVWSPTSEANQTFIDANIRTFEPGGVYTLRVDLPPTATEEASG